MIRYVLMIVMMLFSTLSFSQEIKVTAPNVVAVGQPFKVEFKTNQQAESFGTPSFEGFDIVAGPTTSTMTSVSIINGDRTTTNEVIYTYVLIATKAGNSMIGSIEMTLAGKSVKSREMLIEVVDEGSSTSSSSATSTTAQQATIQKDDILLLINVDKRKVYTGQAIMATIKLATRVELAGVEGAKYPSFNGFWTQEIPISDNQPWERENINNKIYDTRIIKKYILFPQRSGELSVEKMSMDIVARIALNTPAQRRSIFDDFFGGGGTIQNIKRPVESRVIDIEVMPLPSNAPLSFSGAVGDFKIKSSLSQDVISANSSNNLVIDISGNGNLPLLTEPSVELPNSFEKYSVKSNDKYSISGNGCSGSRLFEYPFIARAAGKYDIPSVEFSYFNPSTKSYETISTESIVLGVSTDTTANAENSSTKIYTGVTKEELQILGSDIRFIKSDLEPLGYKNQFFVLSFGYFGVLLLVVVVFAVLLVLGRKRNQLNSDVVRVRSTKARKIALGRLREANRLLSANQSQQFYQETLRAMWGYCGDKLNIEVALLSKINIESALTAKGVDSELITKYIRLIEDCEFAQYAPSGNSSMTDIYNKAVEVIIELEEIL